MTTHLATACDGTASVPPYVTGFGTLRFRATLSFGRVLVVMGGVYEARRNPFRDVPARLTLGISIRHGDGSLAQLVEQRTLNPLVVGSTPTRPTTCLMSFA